jgi:hypothetical protein
VIGAPLTIGAVNEVLPLAPRPGVPAPLLLDRVRPRAQYPGLTDQVRRVREVAAALPAPWQRLVDSELGPVEQHLVYERFVGVTVANLSYALRSSGRALPLDVLRSVLEALLDGLAALDALPAALRPVELTDASVGLGVDGRWHFAAQQLNGLLSGLRSAVADPEFQWVHEAAYFSSPEQLTGRAETPASTASRAALLAWQLASGGWHPFRGRSLGTETLLVARAIELGNAQHRQQLGVPTVPLSLPHGPAEVLRRALHPTAGRFADLAAFRAALAETWPCPSAPPERVRAVVFGVAWPGLQRQLAGLKHEPLLPVRWAGVWSAARTPEEGVAVLEDQLLEGLAPVDALPRAPASPAGAPVVAPAEAAPPTEPSQPPGGLLVRLLTRFRR